MGTQVRAQVVLLSPPAPCALTTEQGAGPVGGETAPPILFSLHSRW